MNIIEMLKTAIMNTPQKGKDDDVPVMASEGEYVIPAPVVALLGDGNSEAGLQALDNLMEMLKGMDVPPDKSVLDMFGEAEE